MPEAVLRARTLRRFADVLSAEMGRETLASVLEKAGLPGEWARAEHLGPLDEIRAAQAYARLQAGVRAYYGRGARGILLRIGGRFWGPLLEEAPPFLKVRARLTRLLPRALRRKPMLDVLARLLGTRPGDVTAYTQDLDLLLVDRVSPAAQGQSAAGPICFVTAGLIREALHQADGGGYDVEETACRAAGAPECRFKITGGG
jgi:predicted hydrocarbon binding protein